MIPISDISRYGSWVTLVHLVCCYRNHLKVQHHKSFDKPLMHIFIPLCSSLFCHHPRIHWFRLMHVHGVVQSLITSTDVHCRSAHSALTTDSCSQWATGQLICDQQQLSPVSTTHVDGPSWLVTSFHYPLIRAVNSASGNARPTTRPVLTGNGNRSLVNSGL